MCGIFVAINLNSFYNESEGSSFIKLTDSVDYRGPDASGYITLNTQTNSLDPSSFNAFLGHRRLSIIDLSVAGNQPIQDNHLWLVYNGEIFNYLELREELKQKGCTFKTKTDAEVIPKIYETLGEDGFSKLNGMWAFIIIDTKRNRIIASRDRFSIKPLYYLKKGASIYFASEIKQLVPLLEIKQINEDVMFRFFQQGLLDCDNETFFKDIYTVKPKTNLIVDLTTGNMEEKTYWDYEFEQFNGEKQAFERFRELLFDSVKIRLRSDVKVGSLLSGGLDSSTISLIADDLTRGNFESFSVIAHEKKYSEERFIDLLVRETKIKNKKLHLEPGAILSHMNEVIDHQDEPFGSFSIVAQYAILKKIKDETDITVVLSGQGGDEVLMGYLKYFFFSLEDLMKRGRPLSAVRQLLLSLFHRTVIWQFNISSAKRYIPFMASKKMDFIKLKGEPKSVWEFRSLRERQISDIDKYSVPVLARYEDRNSMAHSLETRLPFLDHRLVNFLLSLPEELKLKDGWTKYILRECLDELPKDIRWRRDKQGFVTPEEKWLREDLKPIIIETFKNSLLHELGIIDKDAFLKYYDDFLVGNPVTAPFDISRTFIAEFWARKFFQPEEVAT